MKKSAICVLAVVSILAFTGCGSSKGATEFEQKILDFCQDVKEADESIKGIDPSAEDADTQLLENLDDLNTSFQDLAALDFPDEYDYLTNLATEAGEYMQLANENYHAAFEDSFFDSDAADIASQYYERAYKRIQYMITFMQGKTPDDENVQVVTE